ncbi:hypothetical protein [uncultured Shewanella sp.]|uniref:hypothetical protein n=1 Tax=uncultured Shewanella sp. TaxID=173975 RepID=UPI00261926F1|nr:hypothetical protein [uncultured Shewanella sp.]
MTFFVIISQRQAHTMTQSSTLKLLIIEDNKDVFEILWDFFKAQDAELELADNGVLKCSETDISSTL